MNGPRHRARGVLLAGASSVAVCLLAFLSWWFASGGSWRETLPDSPPPAEPEASSVLPEGLLAGDREPALPVGGSVEDSPSFAPSASAKSAVSRGTAAKSAARPDLDPAYSEMWEAVKSFGAPEMSRPNLLERFRSILEKYPTSLYRDRAGAAVSILERMIREDLEHASRPVKPLEEMSVEEQVVELIYQLRDQCGRQFSQPGGVDIFLDPRGAESPASRLVSIGRPAIPFLIEILDDERFSRSVGYHRDFYFSHRVVRYGGIASIVLEEITGFGFSTPAGAREWWAAIQEQGERQAFIDGVAEGGPQCTTYARQLVEHYPDDALGAIARAVERVSEDERREWLIRAAGRLEGGEPIPFLLEQLEDDPSLRCKLAAASALHDRDHPQAVQAMVALWDASPREAPESLLHFLVRCDRPEAIAALERGLGDRPPDLRFEVIWALKYRLDPAGKIPTGGSGVGLVVERLLASALEDEETLAGSFGNHDERSFVHPRICDLAGHALSVCWPATYRFDISADLAAREERRLACRNTWRRKQGLEAITAPSLPPIEPVSPEALEEALGRLLAAEEGPDRESCIAALLGLGLGALPGVLEHREDEALEPEACALLDRLCSRLASIVREATAKGSSLDRSDVLDAALEDMIGRPLRAEAFVELLGTAIEVRSEDATGLRVLASRIPAGEGTTVTVQYFSGAESEWSERRDWRVEEYVKIDGRRSFLDRERVVMKDGRSDLRGAGARFREAVEDALASELDRSLEIGLFLR